MCDYLLSSLTRYSTQLKELNSTLDLHFRDDQRALEWHAAEGQLGPLRLWVQPPTLHPFVPFPTRPSWSILGLLSCLCIRIGLISYLIFSSKKQTFAWYAHVLQIHIWIHWAHKITSINITFVWREKWEHFDCFWKKDLWWMRQWICIPLSQKEIKKLPFWKV